MPGNLTEQNASQSLIRQVLKGAKKIGEFMEGQSILGLRAQNNVTTKQQSQPRFHAATPPLPSGLSASKSRIWNALCFLFPISYTPAGSLHFPQTFLALTLTCVSDSWLFSVWASISEGLLSALLTYHKLSMHTWKTIFNLMYNINILLLYFVY